MINEDKILANIKFLPQDMLGEIYRYIYPETFPEDETAFWCNRFSENFEIIRTIEPTFVMGFDGTIQRMIWWWIPNKGWDVLRSTTYLASQEHYLAF